MDSREIGSSAPLRDFNKLPETSKSDSEKHALNGRSFTPLSNKENAKAEIQKLESQGKEEIESFKLQSGEWKNQAMVINELKNKFEAKADLTKSEIKHMLKTTYENKKEELGEVKVKLSDGQKSLSNQLKTERKSAAQKIRDLKTGKFKTEVNKSLAEMNLFKGKITNRLKTSFFQAGFLSFKHNKELKSGEGASKAGQDLTQLRRTANEMKKTARSNELEAVSIQKNLQEKTEALKSSIRTLAFVETDIKLLDGQIKDLQALQGKIPLVHVDEKSEMYAETTIQGTLSQTNKQLLDQLKHQRKGLEDLRSDIMKESKEPNVKQAQQQEYIYGSMKDGIKTALREAEKHQDNVTDLPTWSSFKPLNLFLNIFQKPVTINDDASPYAKSIKAIKQQNQGLDARLGLQRSFSEAKQFATDYPVYQFTKAGDAASLLINKTTQKTVVAGTSLSKTPPVIDAWSKEAKIQYNNLIELYQTEKSYLQSLLKLEEKLKNQLLDDIKDPETHEKHLNYIQGLIAGSQLLLEQTEVFFKDKVLTETNLKNTLDSFFTHLNADTDFKNYMGVYESAQFMFDNLNNNVESAAAKESLSNLPIGDRYQALSITIIQRGPRYKMLLENIYKESHHPIQDTIGNTFQITNLNENKFKTVVDYKAKADEMRNAVAK